MAKRDWTECASVTTGGKPSFFIRKIGDAGQFARVVWNRSQQAWRVTVDNPKTFGGEDIICYARTADAARREVERQVRELSRLSLAGSLRPTSEVSRRATDG